MSILFPGFLVILSALIYMASYRESWEEEYHVEAHSLLNLVLSLKFGVRKYDVEGSGCSH